MSDIEWSRSRYWLSHFLYSRHDREALAETAHAASLPKAIAAWFERQSKQHEDGDRWLVQNAQDHHSGDPAYIQTLRLIARERQYHRALLGHAIGCDGSAIRSRSVLADLRRRVLGARFELSLRLLDDLLAVTLLLRVERRFHTQLPSGWFNLILREKSAHLAFTTECLTAQYADFNFVRRNLRRLRLRLMCATLAAHTAWRYGPVLRATGSNRRRFLLDVWRQFATLLERMVPYHREVLLTALLNQQQKPYADPAKLP